MNEQLFEERVRRYKEHRDRLRKMIAYMVVSLGYEPRCWRETEAIARELSASVRNRGR